VFGKNPCMPDFSGFARTLFCVLFYFLSALTPDVLRPEAELGGSVNDLFAPQGDIDGLEEFKLLRAVGGGKALARKHIVVVKPTQYGLGDCIWKRVCFSLNRQRLPPFILQKTLDSLPGMV